MYLIFFDDAKNDDHYPHYHIGAVCVDEHDLNQVEERVKALSNSIFGTSELNKATEFHAAEIYHRKSNFKSWDDFGQRVDVIQSLAKILSLDEVRLIDIQIINPAIN